MTVATARPLATAPFGACPCGETLTGGPCPCRHALVHPVAQQDCPDCPRRACAWCELPEAECGDWLGHLDLHRSSESTLRQPAWSQGIGWYGRNR